MKRHNSMTHCRADSSSAASSSRAFTIAAADALMVVGRWTVRIMTNQISRTYTVFPTIHCFQTIDDGPVVRAVVVAELALLVREHQRPQSVQVGAAAVDDGGGVGGAQASVVEDEGVEVGEGAVLERIDDGVVLVLVRQHAHELQVL